MLLGLASNLRLTSLETPGWLTYYLLSRTLANSKAVVNYLAKLWWQNFYSLEICYRLILQKNDFSNRFFRTIRQSPDPSFSETHRGRNLIYCSSLVSTLIRVLGFGTENVSVSAKDRSNLTHGCGPWWFLTRTWFSINYTGLESASREITRSKLHVGNKYGLQERLYRS